MAMWNIIESTDTSAEYWIQLHIDMQPMSLQNWFFKHCHNTNCRQYNRSANLSNLWTAISEMFPLRYVTGLSQQVSKVSWNVKHWPLCDLFHSITHHQWKCHADISNPWKETDQSLFDPREPSGLHSFVYFSPPICHTVYGDITWQPC